MPSRFKLKKTNVKTILSLCELTKPLLLLFIILTLSPSEYEMYLCHYCIQYTKSNGIIILLPTTLPEHIYSLYFILPHKIAPRPGFEPSTRICHAIPLQLKPSTKSNNIVVSCFAQPSTLVT